MGAAVSVYLLIEFMTEIKMENGETTNGWKIFLCIVILVVGNVIGQFTEYVTAYQFVPTQSIAYAAETGPATGIIQGLGVGMLSVVIPTVAIAVAIIASDELAGVYGVAIA